MPNLQFLSDPLSSKFAVPPRKNIKQEWNQNMCQVDKLCKQVVLMSLLSPSLNCFPSLHLPSIPTLSTLFFPSPHSLTSPCNYSLRNLPLFAMQKICIIFRQSKNWKQLSPSHSPFYSLLLLLQLYFKLPSLHSSLSPLALHLSLLPPSPFPLGHAAHGTSRLDRRVAWQLLHSNNNKKRGERSAGAGVQWLAAISLVAKNIRICWKMLEERPHLLPLHS